NVPGGTFRAEQQVAEAVSVTGRHGYTLKVTLNYPTPVALQVTGAMLVVSADTSPYRAGWTFGPVDYLVKVPESYGQPAGLLCVFGWKGFAFYKDQGDGTYAVPAEYDGTMAAQGSGWLARRADGREWHFGPDGRQTMWRSGDGSSVISYQYNGVGLSKVTSPDGAVATFQYAQGKLFRIEVSSGRSYLFSMAANGEWLSVVDTQQSLAGYLYDAAHRLVANWLRPAQAPPASPAAAVAQSAHPPGTAAAAGAGAAEAGGVAEYHSYGYDQAGLLREWADGAGADATTTQFTPAVGQALGGPALGQVWARLRDSEGNEQRW